MKKTRIIAIVLVVALMAMGAGYAAWSEQITINTTATTGQLKVEFVQEDNWLVDYPDLGVFDNKLSKPDYLTGGIVHGPKVTTVTVNKMYPGSTVVFDLKAENLGSIPAKFDYADVRPAAGASQLLMDNVLVYGEIMHMRPGRILPVAIYNIALPVINNPVTISTLEARLNTILAGLELKVGDYLVFDATDEYKAELESVIGVNDSEQASCIFLHLPMSAGNDVESQAAQFDIEFNFKQFNK